MADPLVADAWTKDIACPEGYVCPDYSAGATAYSAQPGSISAANAGGIADVAVCSTSYCTGNTADAAHTCPNGYSKIAGASVSIGTQMGCHPYGAGFEGDASTCSNPNFCPEGIETGATAIPCPAGTAGVNAGSKSWGDCDLTSCAGKWCPVGSSAAVDGSPGYYYPDNQSGTIGVAKHEFEFPCSAGDFSASGATTSATCSASCSGGEFCAEGTVDKTTYANFCGLGGYVCASGASLRTACTAGQGISSAGDTCSACDSGKFCDGAGGLA